jgi:hypothetical protein
VNKFCRKKTEKESSGILCFSVFQSKKKILSNRNYQPRVAVAVAVVVADMMDAVAMAAEAAARVRAVASAVEVTVAVLAVVLVMTAAVATAAVVLKIHISPFVFRQS